MAEAIAELRGELATNGTYSADPVVPVQATPKRRHRARGGAGNGECNSDRILSTALAVPCPKSRQKQQREQLGGWRPGPTSSE